MYIIAICDSNQKEASTLSTFLQNILEEMNFPYKCYYYDNATSLYETLKIYPEKYNCLFLETRLSPFSGITLAKKLRSNGYEGAIIFVSNDSDLVYEAFDVEASQYLLKPVNEDMLKHLIFRLSMKIRQRKKQYLYLNHGVNWSKIPYLDILYLETVGRKVAIYTSNQQEPIYYPCHLPDMENILPSELFIRCHQSFIVQLHAITHITSTHLILTNGTEISISRTYKQHIRDTIQSMQSFQQSGANKKTDTISKTV